LRDMLWVNWTALPGFVVAPVSLVFLSIFVGAGFAAMRVYVYVSNEYAVGDNIDKVILHAALGTSTFCVIPVIVGTQLYVENPIIRSSVLLAAALVSAGAVCTVGTAVPLASFQDLSGIAGTGIVVVAGIWAVYWVFCCVMCALTSCGCCGARLFAFESWLARSTMMAAYGFVLLPTVYYLRDSSALDTAASSALLVVVIGLSEFLAWFMLAPNLGAMGESALFRASRLHTTTAELRISKELNKPAWYNSSM